MTSKEKIIKDFEDNKSKLEDFCKKIHALIDELLRNSSTYPHQITSRIKQKEKLDEKIDRKKDKYQKLFDITDLVGIRIITYLESEVDDIAKIIESEFLIDNINSIDKRILEIDRFGYRSLHYVIEFDSSRCELSEYKRYKSLKAEIQIRSILQHAWAEIEHDIGYKGEIEIPDFAKRRFNRIAALLETADSEFIHLKDSLEEYQSSLPQKLTNTPKEVKLDKASLTEFINSDKLIDKLNDEISNLTGIKCNNEIGNLNQVLLRMKFFNISSIDDLKSKLITYQDKIPVFVNKFIDMSVISEQEGYSKDWSIFYLGYILSAQNNDSNEIIAFLKNVFPNHSNYSELSNRILSANL
ncbi:(p)ppGpp synthetase [Kordia sp. TARA_039_SRF]|nr:(p)ppGpp synthetase [Kordia sp. TARA_039_SRF]